MFFIMSSKIDPREVLTYLNELGYTNITAQQLKEFIIDLKKLLKYDSRYGCFTEDVNNREQPYAEETEYCACESSDHQNETRNNNDSNKENDNELCHLNKVDNIKNYTAKETQRQKHIAVHIYDAKNKENVHEHCVHISDVTTDGAEININRLKLVETTMSSPTSKTGTTESTVRSIRPTFTSSTSNKEHKSKVTFIRPSFSSQSTFHKSDPVALYHYYQSEWKKTKIPGQDNRDDLRWAVRERMLSGPRVEVKSRSSTQRTGWR